MRMTVRGLESLKPGEWLSEAGNRNEGTLRAKGGPHGARFYFRYRDSTGRYDDLPLGSFAAEGNTGMTLKAAKSKARALSDRYRDGIRDLRQVMSAEVREGERQREAAIREAEVEAATQRATLGALLMAYVSQLERDGKSSKRSVERAIERNVKVAWPALWETPAERVTADDLLSVIAKLANEGKLREAAKLRAYIRAAFAAAIRARQDARALPALRDLRLTANPARDLVTITGASQARERALSVAELRAYWKRISALSDPAGAMLRFHLLTGCQRIEQLGRLTVTAYDSDVTAVRLRDGKGRRTTPRAHDVPLVPAAVEAMQRMQGGVLGPFLFTVNGGEAGAAYATAQHRLRDVVNAMTTAGELEKGIFTLGDLRRTVETRLAAEGVSAEARAQLQSHGLGGVQARHYDRHDYLTEKRRALEILYRVMTDLPANVTPTKRKRLK